MDENFKLFTVGPVEMYEETMRVGGEKLPYFRTDDFSKLTLECSDKIKKFIGTENDSEVVILTASGTGAMEAAVMNTFTKDDRVLVVAGGSFGRRFDEICEIHGIPHTTIKLNVGQGLSRDMLAQYENCGYTGLLINAHETSTGVYYDLEMIGEFCKQQGMIFIVDAISSFLADPFYMDKWNIDMTILSSQKAIALHPGLSFLVINSRTVERIKGNSVKSVYFNLKDYFSNMKRGQTPFTPAVGIILQLHERLEYIEEVGVETIINNIHKIAEDFRNKIKDFPFEIASERLSNAVTPLLTKNGISAHKIFEHLKEKYSIYILPSGGDLKDTLFRVGHIGDLKIEDNDLLINALKEMREEGLI